MAMVKLLQICSLTLCGFALLSCFPVTAQVLRPVANQEQSQIDRAFENLAKGRGGDSVLEDAIYSNDVTRLDQLLRLGAAENRPASYPDDPATLLIGVAIEAQQPDALRVLIKRGANVDAAPREGDQPPIFSAAETGSEEIVDVLLGAGANVKAQDVHGGSVLEIAALSGSAALVRKFKMLGVETKWPLHVAAGIGDTTTLKRLIASGNAIDQPIDGWRSTPLIYAASGRQLEAAKLLLEGGANPNLPNHLGTFPLHYAVLYDARPLCELLLEHGADVNAVAGGEATPLDWAFDDLTIQLLKHHGARRADSVQKSLTVEDWWKRPNSNPKSRNTGE